MSTTTITIKTQDDIKKSAQELFASWGINLSTAINMFLQDSVANQSVSFSLHKQDPHGTLYQTSYEDLPESVKQAYISHKNKDTTNFHRITSDDAIH